MIAVVIYPLVGTTMPRSEVENIAREVTVLIKTPDPLKQGEFINTGTGVIVGKKTKEVNGT